MQHKQQNSYNVNNKYPERTQVLALIFRAVTLEGNSTKTLTGFVVA